MDGNLEKENKTEEQGNEEKKGKAAFFDKGGLYSRIPKNEKSIRGVTILVILFSLTFVGLIVLGIVLS